ncbi:MAG: alpha/beta hydrolase [bacterium]|nr:alpha/beta hydrolase [bacterium]
MVEPDLLTTPSGSCLIWDGGHAGSTNVVLVHGFTCGPEDWASVVERAGSSARCHAVCLRGHGAAREIAGPYSIEQSAEDTVAIARHLGLQDAVVVGHSMGARIALQIASHWPEFTRAIVLLEGSSVPGDPDRVRREVTAALHAGKRRQWIESLYANMMLHELPDADRHRLAARAENLPDQAILDYFASMARWDRSSFECAVKASSCPIVVLQSTSLDDCEVRRSISEQPRSRWRDGIERFRPDARVVEVTGASHLPMLDRPHVVANEILVAISQQRDRSGDRGIRTPKGSDPTDSIDDQPSKSSTKGERHVAISLE